MDASPSPLILTTRAHISGGSMAEYREEQAGCPSWVVLFSSLTQVSILQQSRLFSTNGLRLGRRRLVRFWELLRVSTSRRVAFLFDWRVSQSCAGPRGVVIRPKVAQVHHSPSSPAFPLLTHPQLQRSRVFRNGRRAANKSQPTSRVHRVGSRMGVWGNGSSCVAFISFIAVSWNWYICLAVRIRIVSLLFFQRLSLGATYTSPCILRLTALHNRNAVIKDDVLVPPCTPRSTLPTVLFPYQRLLYKSILLPCTLLLRG